MNARVADFFLFSLGLYCAEWCHSHSEWVWPQSERSLETLLPTCPMVCFHGDSKSHQVVNQDQPSQPTSLELWTRINPSSLKLFLLGILSQPWET